MSMADHELGSADCWCDPELHRICPECEPQPKHEVRESLEEAIGLIVEAADPDCWKCGGDGLVGEPDGWEAGRSALLVIHNQGAQRDG